MIALSMLLAVLFWAMVSFLIARAVSWQLKGRWSQRIALLALFVLFMVAPIADELLGKQQFEKLCREVEREGVKHYGKVELGPEFYFEDGTPKWVARDGGLLESNRANEFVSNELAKRIRGRELKDREVGVLISITEHIKQFEDAKSRDVIAEYRWYSTRGGWLMKSLSSEESCGVGPHTYTTSIVEKVVKHH